MSQIITDTLFINLLTEKFMNTSQKMNQRYILSNPFQRGVLPAQPMFMQILAVPHTSNARSRLLRDSVRFLVHIAEHLIFIIAIHKHGYFIPLM